MMSFLSFKFFDMGVVFFNVVECQYWKESEISEVIREVSDQ